jgi:hypothetical protein
MSQVYINLPLELRCLIWDFLDIEVERRKNGSVKSIWIGQVYYLYYRSGQLRYICHGDGKLKEFYSNGNLRYVGNCMYFFNYDGYGRLFRPDGKLHYTGMFEDGLFRGDGYYYFKDGTCAHARFRPKQDLYSKRRRKRHAYNTYLKYRFKINKPVYIGYKGN